MNLMSITLRMENVVCKVSENSFLTFSDEMSVEVPFCFEGPDVTLSDSPPSSFTALMVAPTEIKHKVLI